MEMLTEVSGRSLARAMRDLARDAFSEYPRVGCVCVGIKAGAISSRRGSPAVVALSGDDGRDVLRHALQGIHALGAGATRRDVEGLLTVMASELVTYRSSTVGRAVHRHEGWSTHNCAEANLALYIYKSGLSATLRSFIIASFELSGSTVGYKALCANCAQWCRNQFTILPEYEAAML
jgi:hypothetical protein